MNIEEIVSKYRESIQQSKNIFISEFRQFLEENKLNEKVVRIKDGKIGWLNLTDNLGMQFQYMKKNGERAPFYGSCVIEDILNDFKPFDGGDTK